MKRDLDLIRKILFKVEEKESPAPEWDFKIDDYPQDIINYHIVLMNEAGLLIGKAEESSNGSYYNANVSRLTWEGHEFLDSIKNLSIWNKAKNSISKQAKGVPFEILKFLIIKIIKESI